MTTREIRIPEVELAASRRAARRSLTFAVPWLAVFVVSGVGLWAFGV